MRANFPPSQVNELHLVISTYGAEWRRWINSRDCFLEPEEVRVLKSYLRTGSYTSCAIQLQLTDLEVYFILKKAVFKLRVFSPKKR